MGDVYKKLSSQSSIVSRSSSYQDDISSSCYEDDLSIVLKVVTLTIAGVGLPFFLLSIFYLFSMVRNDHVVPIYVINLLITGFIQLCCMIVLGQRLELRICEAFKSIHGFAVTVSVCFMVVISLERYLVIAWPLWYKFKMSIRTSVIVCVVVWLLPLLYLPVVLLAADYRGPSAASFLLLPFPLLIFFLAGTLKALSAARSVPPDEKRRILLIMVLVLLIYTLLFLPRIIFYLSGNFREHPYFQMATFILVRFSPLADLFLYVFMRRGILDRVLAAVCCCRMDHDDDRHADVTGTSVEISVTVQASDGPERERWSVSNSRSGDNIPSDSC